jgi:ABC-type Fe3+/spermidine/putrescine transport system ATPase subunit
MSDRVVVFRNGQIEQSGPPIELYDSPRTRFVAQFIGDNNLFVTSEVDETRKQVTVPHLGPVKVERFNPKPNSDNRHLLVRPEEISIISHDCTALSEMNYFNVQIDTVVQYGNESLLVGKLPKVREPLRVRVSARAGRDLPLSGTVRVGWPKSSGYVV